jgi:hypothetical protein
LLFQYNLNGNIKIEKKYFDKLQDTASSSNKIFSNHRKTYHKNINELAYNNKEMILDTWKNVEQKEDNDDISSESSLSTYKYALSLDSNDDSNDDSDDDSDDDSTDSSNDDI